MRKPSFYEKYIKRLLDIIFSLTGIIILSPVLIITAILVRIKLGSPVIFTQVRPGKDEKLFKMYKFRTMTDERDEKGDLLPNDQRMTNFGNKIRSLSIDELPELFNILKGDMSFVGPRPLRVEYLKRYSEVQRRRHLVKPGLTGLAQVNGRNSLSWECRFKLDLEYIDKMSILEDVSILFKTVKVVLSRENINSENNQFMDEFKGKELDYE